MCVYIYIYIYIYISSHSNWWKKSLECGELGRNSRDEGSEKGPLVCVQVNTILGSVPSYMCAEITQRTSAKSLRNELQYWYCWVLNEPLSGTWRDKFKEHPPILLKLSCYWSHFHRKSDGTFIQNPSACLPTKMKLVTSQRTLTESQNNYSQCPTMRQYACFTCVFVLRGGGWGRQEL